MRRLLIAFLLLLVTTADAFAAKKGDADRIGRSRHYIVKPADPLSATEQSALEARGIEIAEVLSEGRYLVRVAPGVAVDSSYERLTAEKKIHRAALRAAASGKVFVGVNVIFHDDVDFESAKEVIAAAGGTVEEALQLDFRVPKRIAARIPSTSLIALAADERVLVVHGPMKLRPALDNATSARLSGVDIVHQAPYNLTGAGVVLSFFEFTPADKAHRELTGRLTTHLTGSGGDADHATHVAGTMIASGVDQFAKGMAPNATLHQFSARDDDFLALKQNLTSQYGVVADNNSWGYVLGWCREPSCEGWVWDDTEEWYGGYDVTYTAPLDKITRASGVLMVHSAGNDAEKRGPLFAPFAHRHTDDNGKLVTGTFCYSANGSGTDCPAPTCTAGSQFCETARHPQIIAELPPPYGSIGLMASAKNIIAVGAVDTSKTLGSFSSNGPARDGRVKPDLVARGVSVYSSTPNNGYRSMPGTSMAAPAVTGMAALVTEQWRRTYGGLSPSPAVIKTLLIAGAEDLGRPGPDYEYGHGLANVKNAVDLVVADGGVGRRVKMSEIATDGSFEVPLMLAPGSSVRVVLGWSDPEVVIFPSDGLATAALVNDLDVKVIAPDGETILPYVLDRTQPAQNATRGVNAIDNTEVVEISGAQGGAYRVVVTGTRVTAHSPQPFVVVANGEMDPNPPPCIEIDEPNNAEAQAATLPRGVTMTGRTCTAGDVDYFRFVANVPGQVSITAVATGTPLRVTLTSSATSPQVIELGTGQTGGVTVNYNSNAATTFFVRVEAIGAIGVDTNYSLNASYPFESGPRRRAVPR